MFAGSLRRALWGLAVLALVLAVISWATGRRDSGDPTDAARSSAEAVALLHRHQVVPVGNDIALARKQARKAGPETLTRVFIEDGGKASAGALRWLVDAGAEPARANARERQAMLFQAAGRPPWAGLAYLLELGWSATVQDATGRTLLHQAAAASADAKTVKLLVAKGVSVRARSINGRTALHEANSHAVAPLVAAGAELDAVDDAGQTPLHLAVAEVRNEALVALLAAGASVHAADKRGRTPLHLAYQVGNDLALQRLPAAGAPSTARDVDGLTPSESRRR